MGWGTFITGQVISYIRRPVRKKSRAQYEREAEGLRTIGRWILKLARLLDSWNERWWNARSPKWQWMNPYRAKWLNPGQRLEGGGSDVQSSSEPNELEIEAARDQAALGEKLAELKSLHLNGLITDEEYSEAKRRALEL